MFQIFSRYSEWDHPDSVPGEEEVGEAATGAGEEVGVASPRVAGEVQGAGEAAIGAGEEAGAGELLEAGEEVGVAWELARK